MESIVIAGATGFIGRWFIHQFHKKYKIIALSRSKVKSETYPDVEWRSVDLYSLSSTTAALKGADYGLYLVHSMQPSTRLNQGSFEDTDLLLADNFGRAAERCGLRQIVFIGGILPKQTSDYSAHLKSRYETEQTLASRTVPVTAIRAGIIVGPGGSSFNIIEKLVKRLPVMACPQWCKSPSQPIDITTMLKILDESFGNEKLYNKAVEVGGANTLTYMELLGKTSRIMHRKRFIFSVPFFTLGFSKLWVALFSNSSIAFVSPLIESLRHDMRIKPNQPYAFAHPEIDIDESIRRALHENAPNIERRTSAKEEKNTVRSVQRLANPGNKPAAWVAEAYPKWLPTLFKYILKARSTKDETSFQLFGVKLLRLKYVEERSDQERKLFFIVGGILSKRGDHGWLEFRSVLGNRYIVAAIHEFVPALPWFLYRYTQAVIHLVVMKRFNTFLSNQSVS
ncbi:MAG: NAD-dependent epimerase/dehydratase family protein [Bacteroidota bacterium]